ncbi:uncharacterized protein METZ01_LOCUS239256, partial [marine metagenome]
MLTHNANSNIGTNMGGRSHPKTNFLKKVFS